MKFVRTLTILFVSVLAMALATGCGDAQTLGTTVDELAQVQNISFDANGEVEIVAPIEAMGDGTIVVAGQTVHLTDATEIKGQIDVGTMVKVHVFLADDGTLVAREIEPADEGAGDDNANGNENANDNGNANENANENENEANENENENEDENANETPEGVTGEIEIVALVEALDEGSVTVAGWTLLLTPHSEVKGQLEVGMLVKVHVWVMDDGTLVVREIEPAHDDDDANGNENANEDANGNTNENEMVGGVVGEMEIVAPLEAMDELSVTVAGHTLLLTPQSEVKGQLEVGMLVKVHVWVMDDGTLVVREIEPAHDDDEDDDDEDDNRNENEVRDKMKIEAPVEALGENTIVVAGQTLLLTPQTEVKGQLEVGAMVKVEVLVMADGTLVAREIKVVRDDDADDDDNANVNENNANDDDDDNDNEDHANANDDDDDDDEGNDNRGDDDDDDENDNGGNPGPNQGDHNANNSGPGGGDHNGNDDDRGGDHNDNGDDDDDDHGGNDNDDDDDDDDHGGNNNDDDDDDHGRDDD